MKRHRLALMLVASAALLVAAWANAESVDIFPLPQEVTFPDVSVPAGSGVWTVVVSAGSESLTDMGADRLQAAFEAHGLTQPAIGTTAPGSRAVLLGTVSAAPAGLAAGIQAAGYAPDGSDLEAQGYSLAFDAAAQKVFILGKDAQGALYGATTLEQLLKGTGAGAYFVEARVRDWPHIKCRNVGALKGFRYWDNSPEATALFQSEFPSYLRDVLIPRKINVIWTMRGGFMYHTDGMGADPEFKARLAWGVAEAKRHGIIVEYSDYMACGWEDKYALKTNGVSPYDEIIWDNSHEMFFCYTRTNLIRQIAGEMGQFMGDAGIDHIYCHLQDSSWENCWHGRCSECLSRWPHALDDSQAAFAEAQAYLVNTYYDELKKHVPDLVLTVVEAHYGGGWPDFHSVFHTNLLYPDIKILIREQPHSVVNDLRSCYPGRALYAHVFEGRGELSWSPIYQLSARFVKDYYAGHDGDEVLGWPDGLMDSLSQASFAYYCWNVDAPGGQISTNRAQLFNPRRDVEAMPADAQASLDILAVYDYGAALAPDVLAAFSTWSSPGLMAEPYRKYDKSWLWNNIQAWFPETDGMTKADAYAKIMELHLAEVQRALPLVEQFKAEHGIPHDLSWAYGGVLKCDLLAEPRYWEWKARASDDQADYRAGLASVHEAITNKLPVYSQLITGHYGIAQGWNEGVRPEESLAELESWFRARTIVRLKATAVAADRIELEWIDDCGHEENWKLRRSLDGVDWTDAIHIVPPDTTVYSDTGLAPGTTYFYKVKWETSSGDGPYSDPVSATTALAAQPSAWTAYNDLAWSIMQTGHRISTVGRGERGLLLDHADGQPIPVLLTLNDGGSGPSEYSADADPGTDAWTEFDGKVNTDHQISYGPTNLVLTVSGLASVPEYEIVLYGNRAESGYTDRLTRVTIAGAAGFVNASSAGATFGGGSDPAVVIGNGYNTENGYVARFSDVDPGPDGVIELVVSDGGSASPPKFYASALKLSRVESGIPAAPSAFAGAALSSTEIRLTWQDNSDNEENFKVRRSLDGTNFPHAIIVPANETTHTDTGLDPNTTYYYRVKAEHGTHGDSAYVGPLEITTPAELTDWTAYNDLAWFAGQPAENITTYTTTNGAAGQTRSGPLVDHATGQETDVHLTVAGGLGIYANQGLHPAAGTDAHGVFDGVVNGAGTVSYGTEDLTLTFTGLDPDLGYELVLYCDRNGSSYVGPAARGHYGTLLGAAAFENGSTPGTYKVTDTANHQAEDTTLYNAGHNNAAGYLTRFSHIDPGSDGQIVLRLKRGVDPTYSSYFGEYYTYANAVMLRTQRYSALPPSIDADDDRMGDTWEIAQFGGTNAANGGTDENPDGDALVNWQEFVVGTVPNSYEPAYLEADVQLVAGQLAISFAVREATGTGYAGLSRHYALEFKDGLHDTQAWQPVPGCSNITALADGTFTHMHDASTGMAVFRPKVWLEAP